ncbi:MAG: AsmA family protein [Candidatus Omnitrophica bacterium]|nr:AsmA family protein [Candidatus Omnitrophota bacterium]
MRRFLVFLMAATAIAAAVLAVFIVTLDANTLRPMLIESIEASTGSKTELDGLDLAWHGGVALVIRGLRITAPGNITGVPDLAVEKADLILRLKPLLKKEIEVSSVSLEKPRVNIIRASGGKVAVKGIQPKKPHKAESDPARSRVPHPVLAVFRIGGVTITDGVIRYMDNTVKSRPIDITFGKVDASVKDIDPLSTIRFKAGAAFLTKEKNLSVSGNISGLFDNRIHMTGLSARCDMEFSGSKDIVKIIPALERSGVREIRGGELVLDIDDMRFEGGKLSELGFRARVRRAEVVMEGIMAPVENIDLDISSDLKAADIKEFSARIAGAQVSGLGTVNSLGAFPRAGMEIEADIPDLGEFLKALGLGPGKVKGGLKFSSDIEVSNSKDKDVHSVKLKGGNIRYRLASKNGEENIPFERIDARIDRSVSGGITEFSADMSVFSREKNAWISGKIRRLAGKKAAYTEIKDLSAKLDLSGVDHAALSEGVPFIEGLNLARGTRGIAELSVPRFEIGPIGLGLPDMVLLINKGRLNFRKMRAPIENIRADIGIKGGEGVSLAIRDLRADMAGASFTLSGAVSGLFKENAADVRVSASVPKLNAFLVKATGKEPRIDGALSAAFDGVFRGLTWEEISGSLAGSGDLGLEGGIIMDTNFARETLEKITIFPGVLAAVEKNLSPEVKEILDRDNTALKSIRSPFKAEKGIFSFDKLNIASDLMSIDSATTADLSGNVAGRGTIKFREDVTAAMLSGFAQFEFLRNDSGMIEFPVKYSTDENGFKISPDIPFITSKVIGGRGKELIDNLLEKMIK